jgi:1,4-alpha-glucan branching enzyme
VTRALDTGLDHLLAVWMPRQRWYPAKGRGVSQQLLGALALDDPTGAGRIEVLVIGLDSGDRLDVVQVPLTYRAEPLGGAEAALVGELDGRWVYDGPHDPAYVAALLASLEVPAGGRRSDPPSSARVLTGEQSNTSVVVDADGPDPLVVKVFRTLHPGENPDVTVAAALAAHGCSRVPRPAGWAAGNWTTGDGQVATGHLAVAAEFLAGSSDAWAEAVAAVTAGVDFTRQARELGAATAEVHVSLAEAFGHAPVDDATRDALVEGLRARVHWALSSAPALEPHRAALEEHARRLDALRDGPLPDLQRVHGDYHLGQVLHSPSRGWVLLDFEGEPLRPLSERTKPDVAVRDVVGMLRSFDYAAGFATVTGDDEAATESARAWGDACGEAFLAGYSATVGHDPREPAELWRALWLDKALYEVVYETHNRPAWLAVPLAAAERSLSAEA